MKKIIMLVMVAFCFGCAKTVEKSSCNAALFKRADQYVKNNNLGGNESLAFTDLHTLGGCALDEGDDRALRAFLSLRPVMNDGSFATSFFYIYEELSDKVPERLTRAVEELREKK